MIKSFIKRSIKNNIKNNACRCKIDDFASTSKIIIVYDILDVENVLLIKSVLELEEKEVFLFGYSANKKDTNPLSEKLFYNQSQVGLCFYPNKAVENSFIELSMRCDALIDLTNNNELSIRYLISKCKGLLKIGIKSDPSNLFDIIFEIEKNIDAKFLSQHLLFYLRKLKVKS